MPGALQYAIGVYDEQAAAYVILQTVAGTSFTPGAPLDPAHSYRWKMRTFNEAGWGSYGGWEYFTIDTGATPTATNTPVASNTPTATPSSTPTATFTPTPGGVLPPPDQIAPIGATAQNPPTFQWTSVPGALQYAIGVYDEQAAVYVILQTVAGTSFTPGAPLDAAHSFRWKMRTFNEAGWGSYGGWELFSIATGATPTATNTPVASNTPTATPSSTPTFTPTPGGVLPPPSQIAPIGATAQNPPTFQWTSVPGAVLYAVAVYDEVAASYVILQTASGTSFTPGAALDSSHSYRWKMRTFNGVDWGNYGPWALFSISP